LPATSILQVCPPLLFPFCCARRSTPNPNKTICTRISIQLQYITYYDFVRKNYRVYMCTPMSYAGSAPAALLSERFVERIIWRSN
jgi:hypothetical protein